MKKRLFFGIPLTNEVRKHIKSQLKEIPGRVVPSPNWHITLHFLGEVDAEQELLLLEALQDIDLGAQFPITLSNLGAFPSVRYAKVFWLSATEGTDELAKITESLGMLLQRLRFKIDERSFLAHITLSRFPRPKNLSKWITHHSFKKISMPITEVVLYQSVLGPGGSEYTEIVKIKLNP